MKLYTQSLDGWVHPSDAFITLHAEDSHAFWIDRENHPSERFSVIGGASGLLKSARADLRNDLEKLATEPHSDALLAKFRFRPGLVGAFGYEPELDRLMLVDRALVFDHDAKAIYFVGAFQSDHEFDEWSQAALLRLALVGGEQAQYRIRHAGGEVWAPKLRHQPNDYLTKIGLAQDFIRQGDVYQLCLTNEIRIETTVDPLLTFLRLREQNPAPYASFMRLGTTSVVCASPEQFLEAYSNGKISSKPIKGTRRRGATPEEDEQIALELQANQKERAENLMIVDLMRNDFGQVCKTGSVDVASLFEVETYATVHQLVSTVVGQLRDDADALHAIASAFPGGSMTGAPKIRAMQIIAELEQGNRGLYSGALGYIGADGVAELGMTIRTMVFEGGEVSIGVGGGITIDSEPNAELDETKLKAKALLRALGADDPWS
jgi:para-aminobenzoate synthetase